jgi:hypothetical protein
VTSRFVTSSRFGVIDRYAIGFGGRPPTSTLPSFLTIGPFGPSITTRRVLGGFHREGGHHDTVLHHFPPGTVVFGHDILAHHSPCLADKELVRPAGRLGKSPVLHEITDRLRYPPVNPDETDQPVPEYHPQGVMQPGEQHEQNLQQVASCLKR